MPRDWSPCRAQRFRNRWGSWQIVGACKKRSWNEHKEKGPVCRAEALPKSSALPAAPAVDDARFYPGIILSDAAKVGIEILDLD